MFLLRLLAACFSAVLPDTGTDTTEVDPHLYDTATTEDGSCRLLDGSGAVIACRETGGFSS